MKRVRITFCCLLILLPVFLSAIDNRFEYLTAEDGLSQGNIECIFQDSRGFIWIGTFNGLNRYDGYEIKIFNHDAEDSLSLSHEHIIQMCEDAEGKLWIATYGAGVSIYDPETSTFRRLTYLKNGNDTIWFRQMSSITAGPQGNIWFADENEGIFVYDKNYNFINSYSHDPKDPNSLPDSYYFGLIFDKKGNGWFGVGNNMLCKKSPNSDAFQVLKFEDRIASADDGIKSMFIDHFGNIWLGTTSQGAYMYNPTQNTFINYRKESEENHIANNTVMAFAEDWNGNLLIGIDGGGINIVDRTLNRISTINYDLGNSETINTNAVYALYFDHSDNLWVGTYSGGVNFQSRYKNKFRKFQPDPLKKNSLSYKNVTAIMEDKDGDIWIGTDGGGLNKFNPADNSFKHYRADPTNPDWLQTDVIIHLMQDSEGDIYIASYNHGLTIFKKKEETFKQYLPDNSNPESAAGIHPWFTFEDSYGIIWIGYLAVGIDQFNKETQSFSHYTYNQEDPTSLYSPNVKVIYEDLSRELWIGTEGGGLHKYNRELNNFTNFHSDAENKQSIRNDDVRALYEDAKNRFWVGTGNGLCLMNRENNTFSAITTEDGLPGNTIDGILEDKNGNLWISTDAGISKFNPDSMSFRNYDKTDGLQGNEFNYSASMISSSGDFYFGGKNGFNVFNPDKIVENPFLPPVLLTKILIQNKPYDKLPVREGGETIYKSVSALDRLKLSYKQNIVTFEFSALDFGNSAKNQYKYILENFDEEWTKTDASKRFVTYTNLPGGNYTFRVRASNGDDFWNDEGLVLNLKITPPLWKRKWFIGLVIILLAGFIIRYVKNREKNLKKQKDILEEKLQERLIEVNKQKEEVTLFEANLQKKIEEEKNQKWHNEGMIKLSELMSRNKEDIHKLTQSIITELCEYLEVQQGAIYLINDEDEENRYLELLAAYAPDNKRVVGLKVEIGEGQVGTSFKDQIVLRANNLPEDYALFASGLGEEQLSHLVIIPLRLNEIVIGVIELLSFNEIPDYQVYFVEKSGETLTSMLTALQANKKTMKLLEKQKLQAEELSAQEEELRQNLEEMKATQEELERLKESERKAEEKRRAEEKKFLEKLQKQNDELNYEKSLIDAFMTHSPDYVYFKDKESKFLKASLSLAKVFKLKKQDELIGKSDFDFFDDEHAKPAYDDEQNIIKTEKPIINKIEKEVKKDGTVSYAKTSKLPLYDIKGKVIGTFGISSDITEMKNMEIEIKMRNEELQAQEEELRQNLEEMQTTQEELLRLKEISDEKQAALEKEEYIFNALLDSANESIYFKDLKSRFIRASRSMLKLFKLKEYKDLIGKSDFDFFDDEHAKPAYDDEQRIIKTGKPIIDLVEKEVKKDGSVSWVSTSKMPLRDKDGKIVGVFGISRDVTTDKQLEKETRAANEKLEFEKIMFTALMDNISARITYKDTEGRHLRINKTKSKALGLKNPSEIFGKTDPEVFGSTHTVERLKEEIEQIRKGISSQNEELFRQKDGSAHWGDTNRIPLRNKNGEIVGGLVITWDVTKRKNMQFQLEELTDLLISLSKNLPVIVFDANESGTISEINGEGLKLLKLKDQKTAIGKLFTLFPEIKISMSDKSEKDTYTSSGIVKIDKSEFNYKYLLIRSKSTVGGYSGYIIVSSDK